VWFDSSVSVRAFWTRGSTFPGSQFTSEECFEFSRADLSADQLSYLAGLTLEAAKFNCVADGWSYGALTIRDDAGTSATYQTHGATLGCSQPDGGVELNFDFGVFNTGTRCQ